MTPMDEDKAVKFLRCPSSDLVELAMQKANLTWKEELAITLCVRRDMTQERAILRQAMDKLEKA